MASRDFILFPPSATDSLWRIGMSSGNDVVVHEVPTSSTGSVMGISSLLSNALRQEGYQGGAVVLAVPSAWCIAASISLADLPRNDSKALLYRLEEQLPLPAESLVADFIFSTDEAMGICGKIEQLRPWVQALESLGIPIQSIAPAAFLAAQGLVGSIDETLLLLLAEESQEAKESMINILIIQHQKPIRWSLVQPRMEPLVLEMEMLTMGLSQPLRWLSLGLGNQINDAVQRLLEAPVAEQDSSKTTKQAATRQGALILDGRSKPWIELRQGSLAAIDPRRLHRRALNAVLASAALCLLAVNGAMILRAARYDAQAKLSERQMLDSFHAAFPGWTTPANVRVLLESEHRKLLKNTSAGDHAKPTGSALQTLAAVLGRLPADLPVRLDRMAFNDDSFELQGRVRSYEDVGVLAIAARGAGLEVPTPQARRETDGYWSFVVRGNPTNQHTEGAAAAKQSVNAE